jgi:hypothetical protein
MKISQFAEPRARPPHTAAAAVQRARKDAASPADQPLQASAQQAAQRRAIEAMFGARVARPAVPAWAGAGPALQLRTVADDHVAADLNHPQAARLFSAATMVWWNGLAAAAKATPLARTNSVNAGRGNVVYEQLQNTTLKSAQGLRTWLGKDVEEHMYVHVGSNIYTGGRDREKLPHPTLVGGDPDATCAGTMSFDNSTKTVTITNESGHFRPPSVSNDTVALVREILPKPGKKGKAGFKVAKRAV